MRIGILTGGGDVPGLNPCIKAVVNRATDAGMEVVGIRRGWGGLLNYNPDDTSDGTEWIQPLTKAGVRTIDRYGGTHLHTSRTNPAKVSNKMMPAFLEGRFPYGGEKQLADCTPHVLRALEHLGIDALVPIGGDDTLSFAVRMHKEGVRVVAIPKTMDNDVFGTDYCIGFSTAVTRSVEFINALRTPSGSHERIAVVELFGRNSGETALISAYLADVDRAIISEVPFDIERLAELMLEDKRRNPSNYAMVVISEGASMMGGQVIEYGQEDAYGHRKLGGIGQITGEALKQITGVDIVQQQTRLPDARRRARLARPHGGDLLRQPGRRPADPGPQRPHGGAPERPVHDGAGGHLHPRAEARRRGGAVRSRSVPAQGAPRAGQADVPVLA